MIIINSNEIENLRQKMIQAALEHGLTHMVTIKLSQQLDELINKELVFQK